MEKLSKSGKREDASSRERDPVVHEYPYSGIREKQGKIPLWLKLVAFFLLVWGVYYLVRFWNNP